MESENYKIEGGVMKANRLAVIVSNKKGDCYQVILSEAEETAIGQFIANLHEGEIKVLKKKLPLKLEKK